MSRREQVIATQKHLQGAKRELIAEIEAIAERRRLAQQQFLAHWTQQSGRWRNSPEGKRYKRQWDATVQDLDMDISGARERVRVHSLEISALECQLSRM